MPSVHSKELGVVEDMYDVCKKPPKLICYHSYVTWAIAKRMSH